MEYYIYMLISLMLMLALLKLVFSEIEGRMAKKQTNIRWYMHYNEKFSYGRTNSIILMCVFCYLISSNQAMFTMMWFVELIGFLAVGVIADALSQYISYLYIKVRFQSGIKEGKVLKEEIASIVKEANSDWNEEVTFQFNPYEVAKEFIKLEDHLAIVSIDGGEFVSKFPELPPITYVVEGNVNKANEVLADKNLKVTTYTKDGQMPFKDDKINVVINELANYNKFEMYRVLTPGGYLILDQMGSDNYKEITNMFIPFKMKGSWDKDSCSKTLQDIGFDIIAGHEDRGHIRFHSMQDVFAFMKKLSPERVEKYELYINFYAAILKSIKEKSFFDLTTHKFMIVARKPGE